MNGFDEALRTACLLNPIIRKGVSLLSETERNQVKERLIGAQRQLADRNLLAAKRLLAVSAELEEISRLGPTWQVVATRIREYYLGLDANTVGTREMASISLILGQVLESLVIESPGKVA